MEMVQLSTRLAFLWVMISSLLIFNYYGAAVVSVRLNEPIIKINDSLIELSKLDLKYSSQWLAFFELMIKVSSLLGSFLSLKLPKFYSSHRTMKCSYSTTKVGNTFRSRNSSWILNRAWSWLKKVDLLTTPCRIQATLWFYVTSIQGRLASWRKLISGEQNWPPLPSV